MKKTMLVLMTVMMAAGFNWSLPQETAVANQTAPKGSAVSFMTSVATLDYQGQKAQNRVQMASLAKIERQKSSTGGWGELLSADRETYALSGQGGFQIGKDGTAAFYGVSPITVNRNIAGLLSTARKGLNPWLTVVNGTLNGLNRKNMTMGAWEEPITLSLGEGFPETVQARFRARPLPEPDSKWTLITADSGLISFRALDKKYQDSLIYGRYRGVLVYSPKENAFLQAAAAFILYHGEDQFRIEQMHFAADANGKQLQPVLDVTSYLDFKPEAPTISTQGAFPTWCIQAAHVLDILHLAVMTAAEGATNPSAVHMLGNSTLNPIYYDSSSMEARKAGLDQFLGGWKELQDLAKSQPNSWTSKPMLEMSKELSKNFVPNTAQPSTELFKTFLGKPQKPLYVAATRMIDGKLYDVQLINNFPNDLPAALPGPPKTTPSTPPPPPAKVKKPKSTGSSIWKALDPLLLPLAAAVGAGTYLLARGSGKDGGDFGIGVVNNMDRDITSFVINGINLGTINAGTNKRFSVAKTGSCTMINYSYKTRNFSDSGFAGQFKSECGFIFEDQYWLSDVPLVGIAMSDCN